MEPEAVAPEATPVEAAVTAEPVIEAPAGDIAPETTVPETVAPDAVAPVIDPFEEFGGKDNVAAAHRLYEASRSDDGVIQLFLESGRSLGLGLKDMQALFESLGGEIPEPPDPDEPLTRGEFEALMQKEQAARAEQAAAATQASARQAVQSAMTALSLDPADPATRTILGYGDKYLNGDYSQDNVTNAVRRGVADYEAEMERAAQAYLAKKAGAAAAVPSAPAGAAAPTATPDPEPQNVAEAIKAARRRLGIG